MSQYSAGRSEKTGRFFQYLANCLKRFRVASQKKAVAILKILFVISLIFIQSRFARLNLNAKRFSPDSRKMEVVNKIICARVERYEQEKSRRQANWKLYGLKLLWEKRKRFVFWNFSSSNQRRKEYTS